MLKCAKRTSGNPPKEMGTILLLGLSPRPTFIRKDKGIVSFGTQATVRQREQPVLRYCR